MRRFETVRGVSFCIIFGDIRDISVPQVESSSSFNGLLHHAL